VTLVATPWPRNENEAAVGVTGHDGSYVLAGLSAEAYLVSAQSAHCELFPRFSGTTRPGERADFHALPLAPVRVELVREDGSTPERAILQLTSVFAECDSFVWTARFPSLMVRPEQWLFQARGENLEWVSVPESVKVPAAGISVKLAIPSRTGIVGRVTVPWELGRFSPHVTVREAGGDRGMDSQGESVQHFAGAAAVGMEYARDLDPGEYLVELFACSSLLSSRSVQVTDGLVRCDFDITTLDGLGNVVVRVEDPHGRALNEVTFYGVTEGSTVHASGELACVQTSEGLFRVLLPPLGGDGTTLTLQVRSDEFGTREIPCRPGVDRDLVCRFALPAHVEIVIQGFATSRWADRVSVEARTGGRVDDPLGSIALEGERPDSAGTVRFEALEPGDCEVVMLLRGHDSVYPISRTRVRIDPGWNMHRLPMPRLHDLEVAYHAGSPGGEMILEDGRGLCLNRRLNDDRRVVFDAIPAGPYLLGGEVGTRLVTVPASTEIQYRGEAPNALYVVSVRQGGSLQRAGLRGGDVILGVNGREFAAEADPKDSIRRAVEAGRVRLSVLRDAARIELATGLQILGSSREIGGQLRWVSR